MCVRDTKVVIYNLNNLIKIVATIKFFKHTLWCKCQTNIVDKIMFITWMEFYFFVFKQIFFLDIGSVMLPIFIFLNKFKI